MRAVRHDSWNLGQVTVGEGFDTVGDLGKLGTFRKHHMSDCSQDGCSTKPHGHIIQYEARFREHLTILRATTVFSIGPIRRLSRISCWCTLGFACCRHLPRWNCRPPTGGTRSVRPFSVWRRRYWSRGRRRDWLGFRAAVAGP